MAAAISIAGPGDIFGPRFFDQAPVAFLMIAGTSDAIVDYQINASPIPDHVRQGGLLSIEGGTHAGFTHVTAGHVTVRYLQQQPAVSMIGDEAQADTEPIA